MSHQLSLKLSRLRELQQELHINHKHNQQLIESIGFENDSKTDFNLIQFNSDSSTSKLSVSNFDSFLAMVVINLNS